MMKGPNGIDAPSLYVAKSWGTTETDNAIAMRLRYLYVDRRLADELPPYGSYFFQGETGDGQQLSDEQLMKFDNVPGIRSFTGTARCRSTTSRALRRGTDVAAGSDRRPRFGSPLSWPWGCCAACSSPWSCAARWESASGRARSVRRAWGPALDGCGCAVGGVFRVDQPGLLARVWLTPLTIAAAVVVLGNPSGFVSAWYGGPRMQCRAAVRAAAWMVVPLAVIVAGAVLPQARTS